MLYPEIPKSKHKPTYIGGGIFALLLGAPCLVLFLPPFLLSFGIVVWDWNNLGLNADYLHFAVQWGGYLVLPALLLLVNLVGLFIGRSRSSFFFKLSGLLFVASFFVKYGLWFLGSIGSLDIITLSIAIAGALSLVLGFIFRFLPSERENPNRAPSFLMFYAVFWLLVAGIELLASNVSLGGLSTSLTWFFPEMLGLFGVVGGLWMISTARRRQENVGETVQETASGYYPGSPTGGYAPQPAPMPQNNAINSKLNSAEPAKPATVKTTKGTASNLSAEAPSKTAPKATQAVPPQQGNIAPKPVPTTSAPNGQRAPGFVPPFPPGGLPPRMPNLPPRMPNLPPKTPPKKQGEK